MNAGDEFYDLLHESHVGSRESLQSGFEIAFYSRILSRNPYQIDVLRRLVEIHARRGEHEVALQYDERLVGLRPADCIARYNLACSLAMLGQQDEAFVALDEAMELGYCDIAHLETDPDVESLRCHPGYRRLLEKHGLTEF